jgi:hypothetical protein
MSEFILTPPATNVTLDDSVLPKAGQTNNQDRYVLTEKIIVDQVTCDKLFAVQELPVVEQQIMIGKIRDLEAQIAESRLNTEPDKILDPSKLILQIPGITESYKQHLDFGKVKVLSNRNALEYKGRILKPHEKAELTDKIVKSRERYPVCNYADMKKEIDSLRQQFLTSSFYA